MCVLYCSVLVCVFGVVALLSCVVFGLWLRAFVCIVCVCSCCLCLSGCDFRCVYVRFVVFCFV